MRYYALAERPWVEDPEGGGYWGLPPGTVGSVDLAPAGSRRYVFVAGAAQFSNRDVAARIGDGTRLDRYVPSNKERSDWESLVGVAYQPGWTLLDLLWETLTAAADPDGVIRAKPIMPTHRGVLELHLGGHSLLRAEKLPADPTTHRAWPNIQRVLQNDYRAIQGRGATLAAKWLGAQALKYRLTPEAARDLLIPADLPRELPLEPTTTITDDFNRADGPIGSSAEGWSWTTVTGSAFAVSGNEATNGSGESWGRAESDLSSDDHYAQALVADLSNIAHRAGTVVRFDPAASTGYYNEYRNHNLALLLYKRVAGTSSHIATESNDVAPPATVKVEADGSTITLYLNGVARIGPLTDTDISGFVRTGIYARTGAKLDDFEAADLLAAGGDLVRVLAEAVGTTDARVRALAMARARGDALALAEAAARVRGLARFRAEAVGMAEAGLFARALTRLRAGPVAIAETTVSVLEALGDVVVRIVAEAAGFAETVARPRRVARIRTDPVGIGGAVARIGGVVRATVPAVVGAARRMIVKAASRFNVPPARR